jgi:hypothetical protein
LNFMMIFLETKQQLECVLVIGFYILHCFRYLIFKFVITQSQ